MLKCLRKGQGVQVSSSGVWLRLCPCRVGLVLGGFIQSGFHCTCCYGHQF